MIQATVPPAPLKSRVQAVAFRSVVFQSCFGFLAMTTSLLSAQDPPHQPEQNPTAAPEVTASPEPGVIPNGVVNPSAVVAPPATITPAAIEQSQPSFFVHAEADRASREYYDGEQMTIKIRCEVEAFFYVLYTQADGRTYVVFPNSGASTAKIAAKQTVQIPEAKDLFRWTVSSPFGKEKLKIIASKERIPLLEKPEMRQKQAFHLGQQQIEQIVIAIKTTLPKDQWSEVSLELTTFSGVNPQSPYFGKRYGLFFSVPSQFATRVIAMENKDAEATSNLGLTTITDAMLMRRTLSLANGLDAAKQYPDPNGCDPLGTCEMRGGLTKSVIRRALCSIL